MENRIFINNKTGTAYLVDGWLGVCPKCGFDLFSNRYKNLEVISNRTQDEEGFILRIEYCKKCKIFYSNID